MAQYDILHHNCIKVPVAYYGYWECSRYCTHSEIGRVFFTRLINFGLSMVLLLLTILTSYSIFLKNSLLIINSKGPTNSGTLHRVIHVRTWTVVLLGNALDSAKRSHTSFVLLFRSKTFSFGTLTIKSLEKLLMKSCKEFITTFPMLNISSNANHQVRYTALLKFIQSLVFFLGPIDQVTIARFHKQLQRQFTTNNILAVDAIIILIPLKKD